MAEFATSLHGLSELLYSVTLGVTGAEAVDGACLIDAFKQAAQLHVVEVVVGTLNVLTATLNEAGVEGLTTAKGRLNEVLQLSKSRKVQLLRQSNN